MITLSLVLNILILAPVCLGLLRDSERMRRALGPKTPARGILLSIYLAILALSAVLLVTPIPAAVAALLLVQVLYKLTTPLTVGTLRNPVVRANLGVACVHLVTLFVLW